MAKQSGFGSRTENGDSNTAPSDHARGRNFDQGNKRVPTEQGAGEFPKEASQKTGPAGLSSRNDAGAPTPTSVGAASTSRQGYEGNHESPLDYRTAPASNQPPKGKGTHSER